VTKPLNPPYSNRGVVITGEREEEELEVLIDYLRVSFKTTDVDYIIDNVLHLKKEYMYHKNAGFYGYRGTYQLDNIKIFYSEPEDNRGTLIELSGGGCRQFEVILDTRKITWFDFLRECIKFGGKFPRLDLSIDDKKTYFKIPYLLKKIESGELISRFKKIDFVGSMNIKDSEIRGTTIYFGSKKSSEVYFCFYEKNHEQADKYNVDVSEFGDWNRYELRFKNDRAYSVVCELLKYENLETIAKGIVKNYLRFVEKDSSVNKTYWNTSEFWQQFLKDVERLSIFTKPNDDFYERSKSWYLNQASATRKMINLAEDTLGKTDLIDYEENVELNDKQKHMLKVYISNVLDMIV